MCIHVQKGLRIIHHLKVHHRTNHLRIYSPLDSSPKPDYSPPVSKAPFLFTLGLLSLLDQSCPVCSFLHHSPLDYPTARIIHHRSIHPPTHALITPGLFIGAEFRLVRTRVKIKLVSSLKKNMRGYLCSPSERTGWAYPPQ